MTYSKARLVTTVVAILTVAIVATVAMAMYEGIQAGRKSHTSSGTSRQDQAGIFSVAPGTDVANSTATRGAAAPGVANILQPYPGPGPFQPGPGPFGPAGVAGDGLSAWGVAFKETTDPAAQPDADLIKSAYQDAQKKADTLASATGIKLGKLIAISDFGQNEPYFNNCIQSYGPKGSSGGGGSTGSGVIGAPVPAPAPVQTQVEPVPVPAPCQAKHYVVTWVLVRYQIS